MIHSLYLENRYALFTTYGASADLVKRYTLPGTELTTDVFYFGKVKRDHRPADRDIITVISGTHGLEGAAGSYVQLRLADMIQSMRGRGVGVMLIHALNPYGYHHGRRVDAKNIDVNRAGGMEFITRSAYSDVRHLVEPAVWSADAEKALREAFNDTQRKLAIQAAIMGGQYDYPQGLFYGGTQDACWSISTLRRIVTDLLGDGSMFWKRKQLVFMDIHTGLGDYGKGDIYSPALHIRNHLAERTRWMLGSLAKEVQFPLALGEQSSSTPVAGDILSALERFLPAAFVMPIAVEMATPWSPADLAVTLAAENWIVHHPGQLSEREEAEIRTNIRQGFFPADDQKWLELVWERCLNIFSVCVNTLNDPEKEVLIVAPRGNW